MKTFINETTVKQRLFSARNTVRKEVETMSERNLSLKPMTLMFLGTGSRVSELVGMNISINNFRFVPWLDYSEQWTDEKLYIRYGLTSEEIKFPHLQR